MSRITRRAPGSRGLAPPPLPPEYRRLFKGGVCWEAIVPAKTPLIRYPISESAPTARSEDWIAFAEVTFARPSPTALSPKETTTTSLRDRCFVLAQERKSIPFISRPTELAGWMGEIAIEPRASGGCATLSEVVLLRRNDIIAEPRRCGSDTGGSDRDSGGPPSAQQEALESAGLLDPIAWLGALAAERLIGAGEAAASLAGLRGLLQEGKIVVEASKILRSGGMAELAAAAEAGTSAAVTIGGRTITYDPVPISGMTNFAEKTFHLGREAFASKMELTKTVLHELFRLSNGAGTGASAASAAAETRAAASFADRAYTFGSQLGMW
jgi:hypothetical protein